MTPTRFGSGLHLRAEGRGLFLVFPPLLYFLIPLFNPAIQPAKPDDEAQADSGIDEGVKAHEEQEEDAIQGIAVDIERFLEGLVTIFVLSSRRSIEP
jgi:hypothetical protein